jgi:hypothetical protein
VECYHRRLNKTPPILARFGYVAQKHQIRLVQAPVVNVLVLLADLSTEIINFNRVNLQFFLTLKSVSSINLNNELKQQEMANYRK